MKLTFQRQLILTVVIKLTFNVLTTVFQHWIFASVGSCLCGLLWIIHPVWHSNTKPMPRDLLIVRLAGVLLIIYGIFSRQYFY